MCDLALCVARNGTAWANSLEVKRPASMRCYCWGTKAEDFAMSMLGRALLSLVGVRRWKERGCGSGAAVASGGV